MQACRIDAVVAAALIFLPTSVSADPAALVGTAPAYASEHEITVDFPNAEAVDLRAWVPMLDAGEVPQGLTVLGPHVLVATYQEANAGTDDCRVHRFEVETGAHVGSAVLPTRCNHAGGMAVADGRLFVSDTSALIELDPDALFDPARQAEVVRRSVPLRFPLRGSYAAGDSDGLWIGEYKRQTGASIRYVTLAAIDAADSTAGLGPEAVEREIPAPVRSQGAVLGPDGNLWVSASSSQFGKLYRLDPKDGAVLAELEMPAGTEDLGFDAAGRLWTVSESGAEKYRNWPNFHPFVMRLQPSKLR